MENKVKAGDVWWNKEDNYGKLYMQVDAGMKDILKPYLFHSKVFNSSCTWESGGLETPKVLSDKWIFLYNINDAIDLALECQ